MNRHIAIHTYDYDKSEEEPFRYVLFGLFTSYVLRYKRKSYVSHVWVVKQTSGYCRILRQTNI